LKHIGLGKMPWDMVVFLTITTAGFGVAVKRLAYPESFVAEPAVRELATKSSPSASAFPVKVGSNSVLDLGCLETISRRDNRTMIERTVRVKGKLCQSKKKTFENIQVKNLTTGAEGTVFVRDVDTSFLTDALLLQSGKNIIQVRWKDSPKDTEKTVVTELLGK
jgi:hypothetical protein